jgi:hypothetical protein
MLLPAADETSANNASLVEASAVSSASAKDGRAPARDLPHLALDGLLVVSTHQIGDNSHDPSSPCRYSG